MAGRERCRLGAGERSSADTPLKRLIILLGVAGVSLSAVFVRWSTAPSLVLVLYRMAFSAALLAPWVLLRCRGELAALGKGEVLRCLASGAFLGLHFAAYFESLRYTSIASSVVLVDTEVLFVAVLSILLLKKKLSKRAWAAVGLALLGSAVIAMGDTAVGPDALRGDALALGGALCMAVYTMLGAVCRKRISTVVYTFLVYLSAAVTVLFIALAGGFSLVGYSMVNYFTGFGMALFCTLLGHSVFSWGLKYLPPAFISTVKLMEPAFASVWGLALFGEVPAATAVLGGAVIIAGVGLYSRVAPEET